MWYPQKGSIANGSRRSSPTAPLDAAVVSEAMVAPRKTPCRHERASETSGTARARRPPKRIAEIGHARRILPLGRHRRALRGRAS